ncbi:MAG TPA: NAD(P)/FAD-dependent oxidoreductase [Flavobacteriaceae bacterium]|nr:NAD(P)/FAD-dependent oxidoreductase [Flavobacteriaceae bacterium]
MVSQNVDILVIGAGPSGAVSSAYLNKHGVRVKVVEKTKFPRIVVGESLIPRVMDHFDEAGFLPALNAMNFEKKLGARFIKGAQSCHFDFSKKFSEGWDWTWQVPRADFDDTLTQELLRMGVDLEFESEVLDVVFKPDGRSETTVRDKEGVEKKIHARFVIDASGYGRVLPRLLHLDAPSGLEPLSSIFSHVRDINRDKTNDTEEGTLISFDVLQTKVWLWVIPFSNGNTSVGIVGPTDFINGLAENTTDALRNAIMMSAFYRDRFAGLDFLFEPIKLQNYSRSVSKFYGDGFVLTGNSTEFLDPVFSSGVAFATESGMKAAKLALRQLNGEQVDWQKEYVDYMQQGINVFRTYVKEWYTGNLQTLFFHQPENEDVKRKICSVLAGYVWDENNPFVKKHDNIIKNMAYLVEMGKSGKN